MCVCVCGQDQLILGAIWHINLADSQVHFLKSLMTLIETNEPMQYPIGDSFELARATIFTII